MSMQCVNCERRSPLRLDPGGPGDDHRVPGPAQVARHLLAPLERGVARPRPRRRDVRRRVVVPPAVDAPVPLDQLELLLGIDVDAVQERHLVERAGRRALEARAVVAPDVEDQRVLEVAHLLDSVEQAADVPVGVVHEPRVDLHLPRVELLRRVVERVPRLEEVRPGREHRILGDHAELLLPLEDLLAKLVPPLVELPLVLVGPLLRHVVRRVGAAGRVVEEPRLLGILRPYRVQPLDGLVGEVVREVVRLVVRALGHADGRVVHRDHRVPLARCPAQEAPEVVEAPVLRPVLERACRALLAVRRHVPLAEPAGHVPVLLEDARNGGAALRDGARVARERAGELRDRSHADAMLVSPGKRRRPRRRAERDDVEAVVVEAHLPDARQVGRRDGPAERVRLPEAGIVDEDEEDVRRALRRFRPRDDRPVRDRLVDRMADRPTEVPVGERQHRAVGHELAHRLRETVLERLHALLVRLDDRLRERAREPLLDGQPLRLVEHGDDPGRTRRQVLADLVVHLGLDPLVDEPPDEAARDGTRGGGGEQRRCGQANQNAHGAAPFDSLATAMVGGLSHAHRSVLGVGDEDCGLHLDLLVLDELRERVEVLRRGLDVPVAAHEDIGCCVRHLLPLPSTESPHDRVTVSVVTGSG